MNDQYYKPWHPRIGDRVRYRGMEGVVYDNMFTTPLRRIPRGSHHSHPYVVRLDEGSLTRSVMAAAIELEPLE